jgi:hypothetical protein
LILTTILIKLILNWNISTRLKTATDIYGVMACLLVGRIWWSSHDIIHEVTVRVLLTQNKLRFGISQSMQQNSFWETAICSPYF